MQLDPSSKKDQMNSKYKKHDFTKFSANLNSRKDLQGWRNKLIRLLPITSNFTFADFGCGIGDKSALMFLQFWDLCDRGYLVDFSESATDSAKQYISDDRAHILNADAIEALNTIEINTISVVILFGFLHELENRKQFLSALKSSVMTNHMILVSDNNLYVDAKQLHSEFLESGFRGKCFEKYFSLLGLHFYKYCNSNSLKSFLHFRYMWGRADNIVGFYSSPQQRSKLLSFPF